MNKRRMESLAKFIEKLPPEHFNMKEWILPEEGSYTPYFCKRDIFRSCGTACCIAGWQAIKAGYCLDNKGDMYDKKTMNLVRHSSRWSTDYLDLNHVQSWNLFRKDYWPPEFRNLPDSPQLAAERIRYMIKTGL